MELESEIKNKLSECLNSGCSKEQVLSLLNNFPISDIQRAECIKIYHQRVQQIRTRTGFIYLGVGGFLGFISCVFSMVINDHFLNSFFLYGGTSIAIILAMVGFYFIFE